jgi:hypothetical protein
MHPLNPEGLVPLGELAEAVQNAEEQELEDAASARHYVGGYSNKRRQKQATSPRHSRRAQKREKTEVAAPRAEGTAGAPWFKNPAWWIAIALIYKAWKK